MEKKMKTLTIQSQLGAGTFGKIHMATVHGLGDNGDGRIVAVKRVQNLSNIQERQQLKRETQILVLLGNCHENVIGYLGAVMSDANSQKDHTSIDAIILEYCRYGDLRSYLLQNRCHYVDQINHETDEIVHRIKHTRAELRFLKMFSDASASIYINGNCKKKSGSNSETPPTYTDLSMDLEDALTTSTLVSWSRQIASAMTFIHSKRVLHCDLAARNILLTGKNTVKICDFGLATEMPSTNIYTIDEDTPLPWKWSSLECLRSQVCTSRSDVWSYGVCLWELFSLGQSPYPNVEEKSTLLCKLNMGWRLEKPPYSTDAIHNLMMECWIEDAEHRPEFGYLEKRFAAMEESKVND